jgi:alpha-D-ribose 1-methylphosphonate 5-triphosphate synthase subunit PhnG
MPHHQLEQSTYLSVLSRSPAADVKQFVDELIPALEPIEVLRNRTGLVMVPMQDTGQGATFYLGEALIAEAHVRVGAADGYAACLGSDLEQALAIALIDAAVQAGVAIEAITMFIQSQADALAAAERRLIEQVETTRVEMETF